jgi:hypothetical protein
MENTKQSNAHVGSDFEVLNGQSVSHVPVIQHLENSVELFSDSLYLTDTQELYKVEYLKQILILQGASVVSKNV